MALESALPVWHPRAGTPPACVRCPRAIPIGSFLAPVKRPKPCTTRFWGGRRPRPARRSKDDEKTSTGRRLRQTWRRTRPGSARHAARVTLPAGASVSSATRPSPRPVAAPADRRPLPEHLPAPLLPAHPTQAVQDCPTLPPRPLPPRPAVRNRSELRRRAPGAAPHAPAASGRPLPRRERVQEAVRGSGVHRRERDAARPLPHALLRQTGRRSFFLHRPPLRHRSPLPRNHRRRPPSPFHGLAPFPHPGGYPHVPGGAKRSCRAG